MSQPNRTQTHIDRPLTDMSIGFLQNPGDFIARRVLPIKTVAKQSDRFFKFVDRNVNDLIGVCRAISGVKDHPSIRGIPYPPHKTPDFVPTSQIIATPCVD